jgi:hypothetical protein
MVVEAICHAESRMIISLLSTGWLHPLPHLVIEREKNWSGRLP